MSQSRKSIQKGRGAYCIHCGQLRGQNKDISEARLKGQHSQITNTLNSLVRMSLGFRPGDHRITLGSEVEI